MRIIIKSNLLQRLFPHWVEPSTAPIIPLEIDPVAERADYLYNEIAKLEEAIFYQKQTIIADTAELIRLEYIIAELRK